MDTTTKVGTYTVPAIVSGLGAVLYYNVPYPFLNLMGAVFAVVFGAMAVSVFLLELAHAIAQLRKQANPLVDVLRNVERVSRNPYAKEIFKIVGRELDTIAVRVDHQRLQWELQTALRVLPGDWVSAYLLGPCAESFPDLPSQYPHKGTREGDNRRAMNSFLIYQMNWAHGRDGQAALWNAPEWDNRKAYVHLKPPGVMA